nr:hypothetical protein [Protofrankia symbiont of Coriaria ruscifolia]
MRRSVASSPAAWAANWARRGSSRSSCSRESTWTRPMTRPDGPCPGRAGTRPAASALYSPRRSVDTHYGLTDAHHGERPNRTCLLGMCADRRGPYVRWSVDRRLHPGGARQLVRRRGRRVLPGRHESHSFRDHSDVDRIHGLGPADHGDPASDVTYSA